MDTANKNLKTIKCYKHNGVMEYVDLDEVPKFGSRILCSSCPYNQSNISRQQFQNLCFEFTSQIKKNHNPLIQNIRNNYLAQLQKIHDLLAEFSKKVQESLFKAACSTELYTQVDKLFTSLPQRYHFNDFESIAQTMSESVQRINNLWQFKKFEVNDQKLAEANQFSKVTGDLHDLIAQYFKNQGLVDQDFEKLEYAKDKQVVTSKKLLTGCDSFIAQLSLNFDQSILCARFQENFNYLAFWKKDDQQSWVPMKTLQCFSAGITKFKFSNQSNLLITAGSEEEQQPISKTNKQQTTIKISHIKIWNFNEQDSQWIELKAIRCNQSRITTFCFNQQETILLVAIGGSIEVYLAKDLEFKSISSQQISSEIVYDLSYHNENDCVAVANGAGLIQIYEIGAQWAIIKRFQTNLYQTPKQVIYYNDRIYVLTKDGIVNILKIVPKGILQTQIIVNSLGKGRAIDFDPIQQYLILGDENNCVQVWRFEETEEKSYFSQGPPKQMEHQQMICCSQIKQGDFIETFCLSEKQNLLISSSNKDIMFHYNFI